jgi:membrane fusion protein (multidrug efflux system)
MEYDRQNKLYHRNASAASSLDQALATFQQAEAAYDMIKAEIQQKNITAPFTGRIGIRQVNVGQYVAAGTPMVTLQSLNPLYVDFNLPEQYVKFLYINQPIEITINGLNQAPLPGKVSAINAKVDQTTRNILVQATIPNTSQLLYPGMYALVKVWLKNTGNTIVVPQTAIAYSLSGDYVFLIKNEASKAKPQLRAYRQYVKVGERRGSEAQILTGLKPGDLIASSGQLKLQNGSSIVINNTVEL